MSDFRQQVRDHYDAQSLAPDQVAAILARGREEADGQEVAGNEAVVIAFPKRTKWRTYLSAIAAVLVLVASGIWWMGREVSDVSYAQLPPRVIEFFRTKSPLVPAPQGKRELREWLVSKGAPAEFEMPAALADLENAACQVLEVNGRKAYLSCYWRNGNADRGGRDLVHLLVARADDFRDQPKSETPVMRVLDGWSFASWKKGKVVYTMAAATPPDVLLPYLSATEISRLNALPLSMIGAGNASN